MKQFGARSNLLVVVLTLTAMLGCSGLNANPAPHQTPGVVVTNETLDFGTVPVGTTTVRTNTIVNNTSSAVILSGARINTADFRITGNKLPVRLAPGQQTAIQIAYSPQSRGQSQGTVVLASNVMKLSPTFILKGTATLPGAMIPGQVRLSPASINFGAVQMGQNKSQSVSLSNLGKNPVTIGRVWMSGLGFTVSGLKLPLVLGANQSATFDVIFSPSANGTRTATIFLANAVSFTSVSHGNQRGWNAPDGIASNTVSSTLSLTVSGTGTVAATSTATPPPGQLAISPASLTMGSVKIGSIQTRSATLTNSGGSSVTVSQASVTGRGFGINGLPFPMTLAAGEGRTFSVTFAPQTAGSAAGSIAVASNAANPVISVPVSAVAVSAVALPAGTPGVLSSSDPSLSFSVPVGGSGTQSETVTNSGGASVTISQANVSSKIFQVTGLSLPMTLSPGQSFTFGVVFAPTTGGSASGTISVQSDASNATLTISLAGTAMVNGQLAVSPATLNFGSVMVGQSKSLTGTLTANGSSLTVTDAGMTSSEFKVSGLSLPLILPAGQSVSFSIKFTPQSSGTAAATASFTSNASNSSAVESLTGSAAAAPQHSVSLSWNSSTSSVVGYNLYRGTAAGGPYSQINAMNASTNYVDNSVQAGQTYFYVSTAVDASGKESVYSNQAQVVVPSP